jgi:hypothetical protein
LIQKKSKQYESNRKTFFFKDVSYLFSLFLDVNK